MADRSPAGVIFDWLARWASHPGRVRVGSLVPGAEWDYRETVLDPDSPARTPADKFFQAGLFDSPWDSAAVEGDTLTLGREWNGQTLLMSFEPLPPTA